MKSGTRAIVLLVVTVFFAIVIPIGVSGFVGSGQIGSAYFFGIVGAILIVGSALLSVKYWRRP